MKQARCKNKLGKYSPETGSIIISVKEARNAIQKYADDHNVEIVGLYTDIAIMLQKTFGQ